MLKVTITDVKEVNNVISLEKIKLLQKYSKELKDYLVADTLQEIIIKLRVRFEEEVKIGTYFDINDFVEAYVNQVIELY